jgi:hypothetical protein
VRSSAQEFNALAEERKQAERERQAEQQAASDAARELSLATARRAGERARAQEAERAAILAPWQSEFDRLTTLVRRASDQCLAAETKAVLNPLDVGLATDQLGAERCLVRLQLRLDSHLEEKP